MVKHQTRWAPSSADQLLGARCNKLPAVRAYCLDVLSGAVPAGRLVFLAVERHLADLAGGKKRGLYFDQDAAVRVIRFFQEFLRLAEGDNDGQPFKLQPWQQFILAMLFGWKGADGFRRFRTAYCEIGKGNGKSPMAAGIGLYGLLADNENAAEIYSAAVVKDQAKILFRDAENMRLASPSLKSRISRQQNNLAVISTASFFRPISSEKRGLDGKRPHIVLVDELHEHPSPTVVDKMRAGTKGRRQAMIFEITNSGYDRETVCFYHHDYSRQLLEGTLENDSWFAFVCHLDVCEACRRAGKETPSCKKCDSWLDEAVWLKANPNLGVSIQPRYLRELVTEAVAMPAKENIVKRLNFCLWTQQDTRAIGADAWRACCGVAPDADPAAVRAQWLEEVQGKICFAGLDLASKSDLAADVLLFPVQEGLAKPRVIPFFFVPEEAAAHRSLKDRLPYDRWVQQGFVMQTPGNVIDYDYIRQVHQRFAAEYDLQETAFDPWNATQLVTQLQADGAVMVEHRQGFQSMSDPTKELLKMVAGGEFEHGNNPVLAWMADNLVVKGDPAGNLKPMKPDNPMSPKKIDGIVAFIEAIGRMMAHPELGAAELFFL